MFCCHTAAGRHCLHQ